MALLYRRWRRPAAPASAMLPAAAPASVVSAEGLRQLDRLLQGYVDDGRAAGCHCPGGPRWQGGVPQGVWATLTRRPRRPCGPTPSSALPRKPRRITSVGLMELYDAGQVSAR
ncbi:MAG: hypothetical protein WKG07_09750 [Hymenobacter sp.]